MRMLEKALLLLLATCLVMGLLPARAAGESGRLGVFSWYEEDAFEAQARAAMFAAFELLGVQEVYQYLPGDIPLDFFKEAAALGIDIYLVDGRPEWGLDPRGQEMILQVDRTAALMDQLGKEGPKGLMLDVEPYLTGTYQDNPKSTMDRFVRALRRVYAHARDLGVPLLLCIPHFYDSAGFDAQLYQLVTRACDGIAVMNYNKNDEAGQVINEVDFAREAGKRLIHIWELQAPGYHDLSEQNTYYHDGLDAVWESADRLIAFFGSEGLDFALHELASLYQLLERDF